MTVTYNVVTYEFNENGDLLELGVWLDLNWKDDFLQWNRAERNGIERIAINSADIWLPDFRHFSSFYNPEELPDCANPKCSVAYNGSVTCLPVCSLNAKCDADYSRWPFDVHECNLWYGTWANSLDEVDMHILNVCLAQNSASVSPKWSIVSLGKSRMVVIPASDKYMYPVLSVRLKLVRRASFEQVAILGPILALALMNLYIVWLRSIRFERKLLLGVSICLHFTYLKQLDWTLPYNRDTLPHCMIFMVCSSVFSVVLLMMTLLNCWMRTNLSRDSVTGSFIDRVTGSFAKSRVAELLLSADYLELNHKVAQDDNDNYWSRLAMLCDRAVAIVCVFLYVILFWIFIPINYQLDELSGVDCYMWA